MGRSLSAKLVYGYDLGGGEDEWNVREVDEYGGLTVAWFDEDDNDFVGAAQRRLLAAAGFTETWETRKDDGYYGREREAEASLGVKFGWYGVSDYSEHVLVAHEIKVCGAEPVDLAGLAVHPNRAAWDAALSSALEALGITPTQEQPGWLLCAYYG
ncbi:hypothetical protein [Streptosporangium sp. NPDC051022]|uniref:hypothetical protein n=1 Tax=Streptosporangium sp. NPDC051022 TaxID=3155752 RepID=UPI00341ABCD9